MKKISLKTIFRRIFLFCIAAFLLCAVAFVSVNLIVTLSTCDDIIEPDAAIELEDVDCIIVLGCKVRPDGSPSDMLKDRLDVGIELYKQGIAPKLLVSGDNGQVEYNEIHVMLNYAKNAGIPAEDIFCDHAGFSTYDSMHRAGSIFNAKRVIVVTQEYHEYRALYIGKKLDLEVIGVASDQRKYFGTTYRETREILARLKDFFKALVKSDPALGGEVIPISGSGLLSHDE